VSPGGTTTTEERPGRIDAVPVRHPIRWVMLFVVAVLAAMLVSSFVTNDAWDWNFAWKVMQQKPIINGLLKGTILGTVGAMILGVLHGVMLAVMRLSPNPVLRGTAWVYVWFFRAIPRYVLLVFCGAIGSLYPAIALGIPFAGQIGGLFGHHDNLTIYSIDANALSSTIWIGIIGLGLSEAAYMAEIARAGISSVDRGQTEAAEALGMSRGQTMRRIVLPQAMRVIVPPTGNETIAMLKDTSLLSAIPITAELFFQAQSIGAHFFRIIPAYVAASIYYLALGSVLMFGQYFLERRYGRGFGVNQRVKPDPQLALDPGVVGTKRDMR
jgi:polar amino acid transport system permease protein